MLISYNFGNKNSVYIVNCFQYVLWINYFKYICIRNFFFLVYILITLSCFNTINSILVVAKISCNKSWNSVILLYLMMNTLYIMYGSVCTNILTVKYLLYTCLKTVKYTIIAIITILLLRTFYLFSCKIITRLRLKIFYNVSLMI